MRKFDEPARQGRPLPWPLSATLVPTPDPWDALVSRQKMEKAATSAEPGERPGHDAPTIGAAAPALVQQLWRFRTQYREGRDVEKLLRGALKLGMDLFGAGEGAVVTAGLGPEGARIVLSIPESAAWDRTMLAGFLRGEQGSRSPRADAGPHPAARAHVGSACGSRPGQDYHWDCAAGVFVDRYAGQRADRPDRSRASPRGTRPRRSQDPRAEPAQASVLRGAPRHPVADGLRPLRGPLDLRRRVTARSRSSPSRSPGKKPRARTWAGSCRWPRRCANGSAARSSAGSTATAKGWENWTGTDATRLAELLDFDGARRAGQRTAPARGRSSVRSLVTRAGLLGVLKVAADPRRLVLPVRSRAGLPVPPPGGGGAAERAAGRIARATSADRGAQACDGRPGARRVARREQRPGRRPSAGPAIARRSTQSTLDPAVAAVDLAQIERSIQVCRRIFGGMLNFARGTRAIPARSRSAMRPTVCWPSFARGSSGAGFGLVVDVPADLPPLFAVQADVEQLLLNLVSNARDATCRTTSWRSGPGRSTASLELVVEDTGCGIPKEHLAQDPGAFLHDQARRPRAGPGDLPVDRGADPRAVPDRKHPGLGNARPRGLARSLERSHDHGRRAAGRPDPDRR